jgi:hypothetical protein
MEYLFNLYFTFMTFTQSKKRKQCSTLLLYWTDTAVFQSCVLFISPKTPSEWLYTPHVNKKHVWWYHCFFVTDCTLLWTHFLDPYLNIVKAARSQFRDKSLFLKLKHAKWYTLKRAIKSILFAFRTTKTMSLSHTRLCYWTLLHILGIWLLSLGEQCRSRSAGTLLSVCFLVRKTLSI